MNNKKLEIVWNYDEHSCMTCGGSYSTGAIVKLDGKEIMSIPANAHCIYNVDINYEHIFMALLRELNITVEESGNDADWLESSLEQLKIWEGYGE